MRQLQEQIKLPPSIKGHELTNLMLSWSLNGASFLVLKDPVPSGGIPTCRMILVLNLSELLNDAADVTQRKEDSIAAVKFQIETQDSLSLEIL